VKAGLVIERICRFPTVARESRTPIAWCIHSPVPSSGVGHIVSADVVDTFRDLDKSEPPPKFEPPPAQVVNAGQKTDPV
jgi:hypothetical protein